MKILITGGTGQIATAIAHHFPKHWHTKFLSHTALDIGNSQAIKAAITQCLPDIIINTAAFTQVDEAEKNSHAAFSTNHNAVSVLALACETTAIPLIHLSTDYVFDGQKSSPYEETDTPNPLNIYGLSKWKGEEAIRNIHKTHIILRVSSVFSPYGNNFVKTILQLAKQKEALTIVADQTHCPTSAASIALTLQKIIENLSDQCWGTYHYCNTPSTTWYEFCRNIILLGNRYQPLKVKTIHPVSNAVYAQQSNLSTKRIALRPHYSVLNCDKISDFFDMAQLEWFEELEQVIDTWAQTGMT